MKPGHAAGAAGTPSGVEVHLSGGAQKLERLSKALRCQDGFSGFDRTGTERIFAGTVGARSEFPSVVVERHHLVWCRLPVARQDYPRDQRRGRCGNLTVRERPEHHVTVDFDAVSFVRLRQQVDGVGDGVRVRSLRGCSA